MEGGRLVCDAPCPWCATPVAWCVALLVCDPRVGMGGMRRELSSAMNIHCSSADNCFQQRLCWLPLAGPSDDYLTTSSPAVWLPTE